MKDIEGRIARGAFGLTQFDKKNVMLETFFSDIDFPKRLLHITHTKSKRVRIIPLNTTAFQKLQEIGPKLFSHLVGDMISRTFAQYVQDAEMTGFHLHSLRHTFATNLIAQGVDIYTVSRLLGHSDIKTTMIYAKSNTDLLKTAVMRLDDMQRFGNVWRWIQRRP